MAFFLKCYFNSSRLITDALQKMKGKIPDIAGSHVSSRVLQVVFSFFFQFQINSAVVVYGCLTFIFLTSDLC